MLWQQKIVQAATVCTQARLIVLATAWSCGMAVSEQWRHTWLIGEVLHCAGLPVCPAAI